MKGFEIVAMSGKASLRKIRKQKMKTHIPSSGNRVRIQRIGARG
jgi:hypothetical protein